MRNETVDDGAIVVGARCTTDGCEWGPLGTDDPARSWDIVERLRTEYEEDTGHRTTVECVEQRTILRDRLTLTLDPSDGDRGDTRRRECI